MLTETYEPIAECALPVKLVRELKAKGKTVFLITHRPGAVQLADQLLVLQEGRIAMQGPRAAVLAQLQARAQAQASRPAAALGPDALPASA